MKKRSKQRLIKLLKKRQRQLEIVAVLITICVFGLLYGLLHPDEPAGAKRLVTIYDHGNKQVVLTHETTVAGALKAANINLDSHDAVEPARGSVLSTENADVIIYRSRLVAIADGSVRQIILTTAQSPNAVLKEAALEQLGPNDTADFKTGSITREGTPILLTITRAKKEVPAPRPAPVAFTPRVGALTVSKGAQIFVDSKGVAHRETYYDLPMNRVVAACGGSYSIRSDGAKVDQNGYVLVAANLNSYPRCSVVETSLGPGKVYDTGGFAAVHPYGFDLATDWTNYNGV